MGAKHRRKSGIVDVLRRERVRRGLSQVELAETAGYARETLAFWETSRRMPSLPALEDWAGALGLKIHIGEQV
jgi:transcriptional regulator with XRE-family HTH domain